MKSILSLVLVLSCSSVLALETKLVVEGDTVRASASVNELTRIFVSSDRIKEIKSATNTFELEKDEENGQVFLKVHEGQAAPISLFIVTEQGKTISLVLKPEAISAQTIELSFNPIKETKDPQAKALPYELALVELIRAMAQQEAMAGYSVENISGAIDRKFGPGLKQKELKRYKGTDFLGKVVNIKNTTDTIVELDLRSYEGVGLLAISFAKLELAPNESTQAFLVFEGV